MTHILHLVFRTFSKKEGAIAATLPANSSSVAAGDPDLSRSSLDPSRSSLDLNRSSLVLGDPDLSRTSLDPSRSSLDLNRSSLVLGDPDPSRSSLDLQDPELDLSRSSLVLGDPDLSRSSLVLSRSSLVLGDPDLGRSSLDLSRSSLVLGDPDLGRSSLDLGRSSLVLGDPDLSRSLLLLSAVAAASDLGLRVLFFTQTQIQSLPMCLQKCFPSMSPDSLKKIEFWYPRTLEDLLQQISSLHESSNTTPCPPSLLIVDRLQGYLSSPASSHTTSPEDQSRAAHLSALLMDTSSFLTSLLEQRRPSSAPCRVLASYRPEDGEAEAEAKDQVLQVLDRYFQVRCTLDRVQNSESASVQDVWRVFLSHTDTSEDSQRSNGTAGVKEWLLNVSHDGFMEFKTV